MSRDVFPAGDDPAKLDGDFEDVAKELSNPETELPDSDAVEPELDE
ncbi:MAG: hypothetical protein ABSF33_15785 [Acidimicrobiales bacterium]|jgi:hypothetical protein